MTLGHRAEGPAVVRAGAMHAQCRQVLGRAVALVGGKTVLRVLLVQVLQQPVAVHLGQDGRGGDRRHQRVAIDDGLGQHVQRRQPVAVHQHLHRLQAQALDRALHRQHGGLQDVEPVDFLDAGLRNRAAQGLCADLVVQLFALQRRQHLGIGQAPDAAGGRRGSPPPRPPGRPAARGRPRPRRPSARGRSQ